MKPRNKLLAMCFTLLLFFTSVTPLWALDKEWRTPIALDLLVLRPIGVGTTLVGTGLLILSVPFAVGTGDTEEVADRLVVEPLRFTFTRPLGEQTYPEKWSRYWDYGR